MCGDREEGLGVYKMSLHEATAFALDSDQYASYGISMSHVKVQKQIDEEYDPGPRAKQGASSMRIW